VNQIGFEPMTVSLEG